MKSKIILLASALAALAVSLAVISIVSHKIFSRDTYMRLESVAYTKLLELDNGMGPELTLAMQMVHSPVMIDYMENPDDPEKVTRAMKEFEVFQKGFASHRTFWISDIDKKYYSNMEYLYTLDPKREDSAWYEMTLNCGEEYQFYVDFEVALQRTFLWINALVYNAAKKPVGLAGTGIELSDFVNSMYSKLEPGIDMLMYNMSGEISGSTNIADLEKKTPITDVMPELSSLKDLYAKKNQRLSTRRGEYLVSPLGQVGWMMVLFVPYTFKEAVKNASMPFAIFMVLFVIVMVITVLRVAHARTLKNLHSSERKMGEMLFEAAQNLVVSTKETAATSQDSSAAVKEIVATMEDSNVLSENISTKIKDVSSVANKTSADVIEGVDRIEQNVKQLHEIFDANKQTIDGIKTLSEKIESIWEIVSLINNVADQAKIIAFNAELEASSAGEAGKSFRIVANEIRRLSDGIIDGTREIKEKITEIQHSSDSLILASESGTEKITEGYENARTLGEKFASIKSSAEITAGSANDISEIIQQQASASEQILIALKEISAGVESFTVATDNISNEAENVRKISEDLNKSAKAEKK